MMEDVKIILSFNGKQRYVSYNSVVMGSNMIGPMTVEDAEYIAACLDACRWRKIETAPVRETVIVLWNGKIPHAAWKNEDGEWVVAGAGGLVLGKDPTHYRPIGPLPGGDE
jgi:hypothetical protein